MIHQYKLGGYNIVLDVCSGSVHVVDDAAYDIIADFEQKPRAALLDSLEQGYAAKGVTRQELEECYDQVLSLSETRGEQLGIVDLRRQETFFSDRQTESVRMLILCLALSLSLSPLFWQDTGKGMDRLLASTPAGRRIYPGKMSAAAGLGALYGAAVMGSLTEHTRSGPCRSLPTRHSIFRSLPTWY